MRVGLLTTSFPRTPEDSAGQFVLGFARALRETGAHVEVLAPQPRECIAPVREPGIRVRHVRYLWPRALQRTFYGAGVPDNLRRDPLAWLGLLPFSLALAQHARAACVNWDAIVSHWALPCALAAAQVRGIKPHLAILHSADVHTLCRLPDAGRWARRIARGADGLWFVTEAHRDRFLALLSVHEREVLRARVSVAPMGIDLPELSPGEHERARRELGLTGFTLLALGRLVPVKGIDVLLRASRGRPWTLLIAGDGPERARWQARARAMGTDARFFGEVAGAQKSLLLTAADACVVPSRVLPSGRSEGMPVALLEAMAHGLPVVASAVGGIPALLSGEDRAGLLVPPDRPDDLAQAIERLRLDTELRAQIGAVARMRAERHRWSRAIEPAVALLSAAHRHAEISSTP